MIENVNVNSVASIADYLEWHVLCKGPLSKSKILRVLDGIEEQIVDSAFLELQRRIKLYGAHAPFNLKGDLILPNGNWEEYPELMICLILSLEGVRKIPKKDDGTKLFERVSKEAIRGYLTGEAEVIGYPSEKKLNEMIDILCKRMNEKRGCRIPSPRYKDKGVDVIAWLPHRDNRSNQIVLLIQCAAGIHFKTKKKASLRAWCDFVNWSANPSCGISIPYLPNEKEFLEIRDDHDLVFDRIRILIGIRKNSRTERGLKKEVLSWCRNKLNKNNL